jgi:hypothetical protein
VDIKRHLELPFFDHGTEPSGFDVLAVNSAIVHALEWSR